LDPVDQDVLRLLKKGTFVKDKNRNSRNSGKEFAWGI
jgi:hypothetical protein